MMRFATASAFFGALLFLNTGGVAQECSDLSVTFDGETGTLSTALTGATPTSLTLVMVGRYEGTTTLPDGVNALGLGFPFFRVLTGVTDANGALSSSRDLRRVPTGLTLYFQSITLVGVVPPEPQPSGGRRGGRRGRRGGGGGGGGGGSLDNVVFCVSNVSTVVFP